jgi:hypothetical protein
MRMGISVVVAMPQLWALLGQAPLYALTVREKQASGFSQIRYSFAA